MNWLNEWAEMNGELKGGAGTNDANHTTGFWGVEWNGKVRLAADSFSPLPLFFTKNIAGSSLSYGTGFLKLFTFRYSKCNAKVIKRDFL